MNAYRRHRARGFGCCRVRSSPGRAMRRIVVQSASEPHGSVQALATARHCGSRDGTRPGMTHTIQASEPAARVSARWLRAGCRPESAHVDPPTVYTIRSATDRSPGPAAAHRASAAAAWRGPSRMRWVPPHAPQPQPARGLGRRVRGHGTASIARSRTGRSLLKPCSASELVAFGDGLRASGCFAHAVAGGGVPVLRAERPAGARPGGFRCTGRAGQVRAEVPEPR